MDSFFAVLSNVRTVADRRAVAVAACFYPFAGAVGVRPAGQGPPGAGSTADNFRPRPGDQRSIPCWPEPLAILARTKGLEEQYFFHHQRNDALEAFHKAHGFYPVWVADGPNDVGRRARAWHSDPVLRITEQVYREGLVFEDLRDLVEATIGTGPEARSARWDEFRELISEYENQSSAKGRELPDFPSAPPITQALNRLHELHRSLTVTAEGSLAGKRRKRAASKKAASKRRARKRRRANKAPSQYSPHAGPGYDQPLRSITQLQAAVLHEPDPVEEASTEDDADDAEDEADTPAASGSQAS